MIDIQTRGRYYPATTSPHRAARARVRRRLMSPPGALSASPPVRASGFGAAHRSAASPGRSAGAHVPPERGAAAAVVADASPSATADAFPGARARAPAASPTVDMTAAMASAAIAGSGVGAGDDDARPAGPGTPPIGPDARVGPGPSDPSALARRAAALGRASPSPGLVVGLGDPVSDILVRLDEPRVAARVFDACGIDEPGGCLPVATAQDVDHLLAACAREWIQGGAAGADGADPRDDSVAAPEPTYCPGGSAANVMKGIANLGGEAAFVGMIASDDVGARYRRLLEAQGVRPVLLESAAAAGGLDDDGDGDGGASASGNPQGSARCLSIVEKGGQRTMRTYLGASLSMRAEDFPAEEALGRSPRLLHVEGYTLYRPELAEAAMRAAKARGALVSLDLASFEVVRNCRDALRRILASGVVDLLFANEDEAAELTGQVSSPSARPRKRASEDGAKKRAAAEAPERAAEDERDGDEASEDASEKASASAFTREDADAALEKMLEHCAVAVVSLGARGCVAKSRAGDRGVAPGVRVPVVDTTGAGDSFTAGFLAAYLQGARLQACASCGCAVGTQMVQVLGAELAPSVWSQLASQTRGIVQRSNSVVDA